MNKTNFPNKKIGIWGLGIVGQSALRFFSDKGAQCTVFDQKKDNPKELGQFLESNEYTLPSPGIDLRPYAAYKHKFLAEADIFGQFWHKPIIGITGSVGKTTVTILMAQVMEAAGYKVAVGGNIGIGMLDLIAEQESYDYAILELSSFQLELCKSFAPDLAIWTNFYPNHLDRHGNMDDYFKAKMNILRHAKQGLVGEGAWKKVKRVPRYNPSRITRDELIKNGSKHVRSKLGSNENKLIKIHPEWPAEQIVSRDLIKIIDKFIPSDLRSKLYRGTHPQNWQTIIQALELLKIPFPDISKINFKLPEHRLEKVATINGITFWNDSKATIAEATLAAVDQLAKKPIILLLGGISKGVDRRPLISELIGRVKHIIAFGDERNEIMDLCNQEALPCISCPTLQTALDEAIKEADQGYQILLSPGGTSFDLFTNYQTRGKQFKKLLTRLKN